MCVKEVESNQKKNPSRSVLMELWLSRNYQFGTYLDWFVWSMVRFYLPFVLNARLFDIISPQWQQWKARFHNQTKPINPHFLLTLPIFFSSEHTCFLLYALNAKWMLPFVCMFAQNINIKHAIKGIKFSTIVKGGVGLVFFVFPNSSHFLNWVSTLQ